jgi:hypothetical protein
VVFGVSEGGMFQFIAGNAGCASHPHPPPAMGGMSREQPAGEARVEKALPRLVFTGSRTKVA